MQLFVVQKYRPTCLGVSKFAYFRSMNHNCFAL